MFNVFFIFCELLFNYLISDDVIILVLVFKFKFFIIIYVDIFIGVFLLVDYIVFFVKKYFFDIFIVFDVVCLVVFEEIKFDEWGLDVVFSVIQKGFGVFFGLSVVFVSKRVVEVRILDVFISIQLN